MSTAPPGTDGKDRIAAAVVDLVARGGLERASVREVAAAAGVSIGAVQHHFPTKDAMLVGAFERIVAATEARIAAVPYGRSVPRNLSRVLRELLPLDRVRHAEAKVYVAFAARAATSAPLAQVQLRSQQRILTGLRAALRLAELDGLGAGQTPAIAARADAELLLAVCDGLTFDAVSNPADSDPARTGILLDRYLSRLLCPGGAAVPSG